MQVDFEVFLIVCGAKFRGFWGDFGAVLEVVFCFDVQDRRGCGNFVFVSGIGENMGGI